MEIRAGIRSYGRFPNLLREGIPMKRILVAVLSTLALALGLSGPASAATANSHASCSGLAAASRAGDPGAQAATQVQIKVDAKDEGVTPGAVVSGFSQFHDGSAEVCLA